MNRTTTRTIADRKYENVAGKWVHTISTRHTIVIERVEDGWKATELKASKKGTLIGDVKRVVKRSVMAPAMWEAANRLEWIIKNQPALDADKEV